MWFAVVVNASENYRTRNINLTNSVVAYNDVRKHKNTGAGRRQEMRRLIPSFSRCARAVYEPLASIARGLQFPEASRLPSEKAIF